MQNAFLAVWGELNGRANDFPRKYYSIGRRPAAVVAVAGLFHFQHKEEKMRDIPSRQMIEAYQKRYPPGSRIEMTDDVDGETIKNGDKGTVFVVDDIGTVHVDFDNGHSLGLLPYEDHFKRIKDDITLNEPAVKKPAKSSEPER